MIRTIALKFQISVPSFQQQAHLITQALKPFYDSIIIPKTSGYGQSFTTYFVFTPALASYMYQTAMLGCMMHAQKVMYVTAEGYPHVSEAQTHILNDRSYNWTILAVSNFTKRMLEKKDVHVNGIVPHGIDEDEPYRVQSQTASLRKHYQELYPNRMLIAYTGSEVARKRVDLMIPAFRKAVQKTGQKIALISHSKISYITKGIGRKEPFKGLALTNPKPVDEVGEWFLEESAFGHSTHEYVIALSGACDAFLWSTLCEGFGVPPLKLCHARNR